MIFFLFRKFERRYTEPAPLQAEFGYEFVKGILDAVIQPQKPPNPLYSSEIVRRLVQQGVLRSTMVEGGLLCSLRMRDDWVSYSSLMFSSHRELILFPPAID
jgi:gephyrin